MIQSTLPILWRQVWGLSALLTAILISFKAYELYQPGILTELGFGALIGSLAVIQGLLGSVVNPIVSGFSDAILRRTGSRLPQIVVGITLAGLIFVIVAWLVSDRGPIGIRWLIPALMVLWLMAMIAVRGPAIALLKQFAPVTELPQANSLIILVLGLVSAVNPLLEILLKQLGASLTFMVGAIALLIGAALLFSTTPQHTLSLFTPTDSKKASPQLLSLIFLIGLGASLELILLMSVFARLLQVQLGLPRIEWVSAAILFVAAITANPLSKLTTHLGPARAIQVALGTIALVMGVISLHPGRSVATLLVLVLGVGMGLLLISIIPFCLANVPLTQAGLSTGLYFGGNSLASAIAAFLQATHISVLTAFGWTIASFAATAFCLQVTQQVQRRRNFEF